MTKLASPVIITVKDKSGAYQTNTVCGMRASSTSSARAAAERLAEKLFGASVDEVNPVPGGVHHPGATIWQVTATQFFAWCWASGLIEIGRAFPPGAIPFATGFQRPLVHRVAVLARHGKGTGSGQLLVPGVPEAVVSKKGLAAEDALRAWVDCCARSNGKTHAEGVVFARGLKC